MENELYTLLFEVTQRCNARCKHCGSRCEIDSPELLTKDDMKNVLTDIKDNIGTDVMINVSGGEPMMRSDIYDITRMITDMGFDWGLVTNGYLLNEENIQKFKESGMKTITISLDGTEKIHEYLRGLPEGSFNKIIENIRLLKKAKYLDHIQVTFIANTYNIDSFKELYDMVDKLRIDSVRVGFCDLIGRAEDNEDLMLNRQQMEYFMSLVNDLNKDFIHRTPIVFACSHYFGRKVDNHNFDCFTGRTAASILYNGDIYVCPNVPRDSGLVQGNIRKDSFFEIWKNGFKNVRNRPQPEYCKKCMHWNDCKGDSLHTWDFKNDKPKFCYRDIFDTQTKEYLDDLKKREGDFEMFVVENDGSAPDIYLEKEAYDDIKHYFHVGKKNPLSMYEQQMGLIGFKIDGNYVIKYVFPSFVKRLDKDLAMSTKYTLKQIKEEVDIAVRNFSESDDKDDYIADGLRFLGFIHSHPVQEELQYSVGDEIIHNNMIKAYKDYIGILINPSLDAIGAYVGKDIIQGNLKIII